MRFDPTRDNLFCMRDGEAHAKLRNKMTAGVITLLLSSYCSFFFLLFFEILIMVLFFS